MLTNDIINFEQLGPDLQSEKMYFLTYAPRISVDSIPEEVLTP